MATEQRTETSGPASEAVSVIENEIPSYRAISGLATASLVCGGLSVFSFAHYFFLGFSVLAILLGILAHRSISKLPDVLTGAKIANAGIGLGLMFGLASTTIGTIQHMILKREASKFAIRYIDILKSPTLGDVLLYNLAPDARKDKDAGKMMQQYEASQARERMAMEQRMGPVLRLRSRLLSSPEQKIVFDDIEDCDIDSGGRSNDIIYYALARYRIEGPTSKDWPDPVQYAVVILKAQAKGRKYEWWAEDVAYPYKPASYVPAPKPVDDGHGHGH